jgi:hypothetical protein
MANYRRTATGDWSNLAQWEDDSGGSYAASTVLPGPGDVVYANGFFTSLDIDIVVDELRNDTATSITGGGRFTYTTGNNVVANVFASSNAVCLLHNTISIKNLTGNITAILNQGLGAVQNSSLGTLNIIGNCTGGSGFQCFAVWNDGGTINITGNLVGGTANSSACVRNNSTGTINIIGIAEGGDVPGNTNPTGGGPALFQNGSGTIRVHTLKSSTTSSGAIHGNLASSSGVIIVEHIIYASNGFPVSLLPLKFDNTSPKSAEIILEDNSTLTLVDPTTADYPLESDTRFGVSYNFGGLTGTAYIPPSNTVALGVPVDNTVGSAVLTINDFLALMSSFKILT